MSLQDILSVVPAGSPEESARAPGELRSAARNTSPSSWTATAAGRRSATCPASKGIAPASSRSAKSSRVRPALGIKVLTLYAFSVENWKRPVTEVSTLMMLLKRYLRLELNTLLRNDIRFRVIGRADELAPDVRGELKLAEEKTARNRGMLFNIALNYGGRAEIVEAARRAHRRRRSRPTSSTSSASAASFTPPVSPIPTS